MKASDENWISITTLCLKQGMNWMRNLEISVLVMSRKSQIGAKCKLPTNRNPSRDLMEELLHFTTIARIPCLVLEINVLYMKYYLKLRFRLSVIVQIG